MRPGLSVEPIRNLKVAAFAGEVGRGLSQVALAARVSALSQKNFGEVFAVGDGG